MKLRQDTSTTKKQRKRKKTSKQGSVRDAREEGKAAVCSAEHSGGGERAAATYIPMETSYGTLYYY